MGDTPPLLARPRENSVGRLNFTVRAPWTSPVYLVIWSVWSIWLVSCNQANQSTDHEQETLADLFSILLGNFLMCAGASGLATGLLLSQALPHQADMMLQRVEHVRVRIRHAQVIGTLFQPV